MYYSARCNSATTVLVALLAVHIGCAGPRTAAAAVLSNPVAKFAESHFDRHGAKLPTREFLAALRDTAVDTQHLSCRKSLVLLGMANEEALAHTVPLFLESLRRVPVTNGAHSGRSLDQHLMLVAWSEAALTACKALNSRYGHKCVRDAEHTAATGSFGFHDAKFNSLGFAKIKYILNGLSAGHDVVFLDMDIIVLQDPLPYFLGRGADMWGSMEKCMIYPDSMSFHSTEFQAFQKKLPPLNIGVLYFKATAGVTRCVYNWLMEMYSEVLHRPRVWDQDIYGKVMVKCTAVHELRWQVLDPRLFQSACFRGCGCTFSNADMTNPERVGKFAKGHKPDKQGRCSPDHFGSWLMRHFPCSGLTHQKAKLMTGLMEGFFNSTSAVITRDHR